MVNENLVAPGGLGGLARQLVQAGALGEAQAGEAWVAARNSKMPFVTWLVQHHLVSSRAILEVGMDCFGLPCVDLEAVERDSMPERELVSEKLIRQHRVLPLFKRGNKLFIALSDPTLQQPVTDIQFTTRLVVEAVLADDQQLGVAIERYLDAGTGAVNFSDADLGALAEEARQEQKEEEENSRKESETEDGPVVRFVNKMLLEAIRRGSSDLHFEPYENIYRVRFRTDGVLHEVAHPPVQLVSRISARLKVMAGLDIAEKRRPQDGRIKLNISSSKAIDFRVSTLPTLWGEKVVMRILDSASARMGIDALGYEDDQKALYLEALNLPQGMILVTGPTGSGKTVSLYTGLNILNTPDVNISTAEDPVEINLEGINQVNVNPKQGLDFASALRAFLRQDPDIIMVGEIRDLETAEIAIKAAQTGHLVLSTLHTNSAAETLTRLRNMGVQSFNIATSVNLIIAQRLARKLCPKCRKVIHVPDEALLEEGFPREKLGTFTLYGPVGCEDCNGGYRGRTGIYEVARITPALQELIMADGNSIEIAARMRAEGFKDLRTAALHKVMQGITSLEEVNRVTED